MTPNTGSTAEGRREPIVNILLVDDRLENLLALESVLSSLGQKIVTARSGTEALRKVLDHDFACILLDVQMPEMNGFETATLIRSRERSQHTPILFLTAINKSDRHVNIGYSVGAVDYVFKPIEPDILKAKVSAFVDLSIKTKELEMEVERRKQAEAEVRKLNDELEERVRRRTADLERTNRKLQREIAERRRAEDAIRRSRQDIETLNQRLQRSMTETHHRVKNNLQVIAAMVDMRLLDGDRTIDPAEMKRLGMHVRTLAAVHDLLTEEAKADGEAHWLSAEEILERLVGMLENTTGGRELVCKLQDARLTARQGTSLALVTNELISNALKYGRGSVEIALINQGDRATLRVSDDGPGFPPGFDPEEAGSTGLELVQNLSRWDLGGSSRYLNRPEGGAVVEVTIPIHASLQNGNHLIPKSTSDPQAGNGRSAPIKSTEPSIVGA